MPRRSYEPLRVTIPEFRDTDIVNASVEDCAAFLDPLIKYWDIDLVTFGWRSCSTADSFRATP